MAQGSEVVGYSVQAQRIIQQPSRELVSISLSPAYDMAVEEKQAEVTRGLGIYYECCQVCNHACM